MMAVFFVESNINHVQESVNFEFSHTYLTLYVCLGTLLFVAGTVEVLEQLFEVDEDDDNDNVFHSSDESSDDDHFCPKAGKS